MRLDELERELRAERQEPNPDFARRLDEWARDGFPPDRGLGPRLGGSGPRPRGAGPRGGALARLRRRLGATAPRRVLVPVGAVATVVVVVGVAISQSGDLGTDDSATNDPSKAASPNAGGTAA
ncbi:MAG: hypothetical protein GEU88_00700, partial [Solirubrobacterales bacterium]|nr:hypothetical protein [Solirubrobacterales bacterium]